MNGREFVRREPLVLEMLSSPASLLTQTSRRVAGHLDRSAVAEHVPEHVARTAAAREEREQREVLRADDRDAHRVVLGVVPTRSTAEREGRLAPRRLGSSAAPNRGGHALVVIGACGIHVERRAGAAPQDLGVAAQESGHQQRQQVRARRRAARPVLPSKAG